MNILLVVHISIHYGALVLWVDWECVRRVDRCTMETIIQGSKPVSVLVALAYSLILISGDPTSWFSFIEELAALVEVVADLSKNQVIKHRWK